MTHRFRELHYGTRPLVLPNAWDLPSALMLLDAGFTALGTTSCGSLPYRAAVQGAVPYADLRQKLVRFA